MQAAALGFVEHVAGELPSYRAPTETENREERDMNAAARTHFFRLPTRALRLLRRAIDARASSPLHAFPAADSLNFNDDGGVD